MSLLHFRWQPHNSNIRVGPSFQPHMFIQKFFYKSYDLISPHRIISSGFLRSSFFTNDIRAIQCIIEGTPAGIGSVQRVTCIVNWHDELRPCLLCNNIINIFCANCKIFYRLFKIADFLKKCLIFIWI